MLLRARIEKDSDSNGSERVSSRDGEGKKRAFIEAEAASLH